MSDDPGIELGLRIVVRFRVRVGVIVRVRVRVRVRPLARALEDIVARWKLFTLDQVVW